MLDADLALLYKVEARTLVQAVKRNLRRFPMDFMFQLTEEEWALLRSHSVISKGRGGRRYAPYQAITGLINTIRQMMKTPEVASRPIGFTADIRNKKTS